MKRTVSQYRKAFCVALLCGSSLCSAAATQAANVAVGNSILLDTPPDHWAYAALAYLRPYCSHNEPSASASKTMTRYEFAVFLARLLSAGTYTKDRDACDVVAGLKREFRQELADLGVRDPDEPSRLDSSSPILPRLHITPSLRHRITR